MITWYHPCSPSGSVWKETSALAATKGCDECHEHGKPTRCFRHRGGRRTPVVFLQLKMDSENTGVVFCLLLQTYTQTGCPVVRLHAITLTQVSRSFPTFALSPRHGWEAHVVIGSVLGRGVGHAGLWLRLCLLPVVAASLLPPSTHRLWRCLLWWAERRKSSAQSSWCGGFAGKWRTTYGNKNKERNAILSSL